MSTNHLNTLKDTISLVHGDVGKQWWLRLPQFLEHLAYTQELTLLAPFEHLSFNYVLPVLSSKGEEWVLKVSVPHDEFSREIHALRHFNRRGSARLIDANPEEGWMLVHDWLMLWMKNKPSPSQLGSCSAYGHQLRNHSFLFH